MNRILCFGGRDFTDSKKVNDALDQLFYSGFPLTDSIIIHGGAKGADTLSGNYGSAHGVPVIVVPANWGFYKLKAGSVRNQWMLDYCSVTHAVEFPGGAGTADMRRRLEGAGIWIYRPYP